MDYSKIISRKPENYIYFLFAMSVCLLLLISNVSAKCTVLPCPNSKVCPGATEFLEHGCTSIDYTVKQVGSDARKVQFIDMSQGKIDYIRWDFGDGTYLEKSGKITNKERFPIHTFKTTGHYIGAFTVSGVNDPYKLWLHKDIVLRNVEKQSKCGSAQFENP